MDPFVHLHVASGYTALGLVAFRLLWGFVGTRYARFSGFALGAGAFRRYVTSLVRGAPEHYVGHNPVGSYVIVAMLVLAVLTGLTGFLTLQEIGGEAFEEVHEVELLIGLAQVVAVALGQLGGRDGAATDELYVGDAQAGGVGTAFVGLHGELGAHDLIVGGEVEVEVVRASPKVEGSFDGSGTGEGAGARA